MSCIIVWIFDALSAVSHAGFVKHDWTPIISQRLGVDEPQTPGSICQDVCVCVCNVCFAMPCGSGRIITHFK